MPRSNLSSTPFAGRIDERKESGLARLDRSAPAAELRAEARREPALRSLDAAGECDRVDVEEPASRKRQQREAPSGGRGQRQPYERVAVDAVDDAVVAQESALELRRLTRAERERDARIERDGRIELQLDLRRELEAQLLRAVRVRRDRHAGVGRSRRARPQRVEREADVMATGDVEAAIDAEQQLRRRRRVGLGHHRARKLLLDTPWQLPQPVPARRTTRARRRGS